jgi:probable F420-dependent oxidoreductase
MNHSSSDPRWPQVGVVYPQYELSGDPRAVGRFGVAAEEFGFDHVLAYDHVLGAVHRGREPELSGPYDENDAFHDPFVLFAYLSGLTSRIQFVTGVLVVPQRQTVLVARQAADVDLISGERLRLGLGVGWNYVEYEALGQDFRSRGAREEEQIELLRRLFSEPVVDFAGRFDRVDRAAIVPRPQRQIPIWLGGFSEVALDRAARLADGFIFYRRDFDQTIEAWHHLQTRLAQAARSVETMGGDYVVLDLTGDHVRDVARLSRDITRWSQVGGTHVSLSTMRLGFDSVDAHLDYLGSVASGLRLR